MSTLLEEPFFSYFDLPEPPAWLRRVVHGSLRLRGRVAARFASGRGPHFYTDGGIRSYPDGYTLRELGPPEDWRREGAAGARKAVRAVDRKGDRYCHHVDAIAGAGRSRR